MSDPNFLGTMFQRGTAPVLEATMRFAENRHRRIVSNVANADTPNYRRQDLDADRFTRELSRAIRERSDHHPNRFEWSHDTEVPVSIRGGTLPGRIVPFGEYDGPLRHDENDVSVEREMAILSQNASRYRTMSRLLDKEWTQIRAAIDERTTTT